MEVTRPSPDGSFNPEAHNYAGMIEETQQFLQSLSNLSVPELEAVLSTCEHWQVEMVQNHLRWRRQRVTLTYDGSPMHVQV